MHPSRSILAAVIAAAVLLAPAAPPAQASSWNHKWSYLRFLPADHHAGDPDPRRTITLNGTYRWRAFSAHWAHQDQPSAKSRTLRLRGRYEWHDGLYVRQGAYRHVSELVNTRTGGRVSIVYRQTGGYGDGRYHWGSTLDNVRG